jgi:hypothetical protein
MRVSSIFVVVLGTLATACVSIDDIYAGNYKGYRGVLTTDGRDLGRHELEQSGTFGTVANGSVGSCSRSPDRRDLMLDVAFDSFHRSGTFTIDRKLNAEGVDIDVAWSHHFIPKSDCSRFEVDDDPSDFEKPYDGRVKLTCKQPGPNGDALNIDVEIRGC